MPGGDLLSRGTAPQVPSALAGFTSVFGMGTGGAPPLSPPDKSLNVKGCQPALLERSIASTSIVWVLYPSPRPISTGPLNALLHLHLRPIDVVVYHGPQGYLVLRGASRLDAFSGYPVRS